MDEKGHPKWDLIENAKVKNVEVRRNIDTICVKYLCGRFYTKF